MAGVDAKPTTDGLPPLNALRVVVSPHMAGMKKAVKSGGTIYVSPAMWSLLMSEEGEALERLLRRLPLTDIGECWFARLTRDGLQMVTIPPPSGKPP